jgi:hypothetical protein
MELEEFVHEYEIRLSEDSQGPADVPLPFPDRRYRRQQSIPLAVVLSIEILGEGGFDEDPTSHGGGGVFEVPQVHFCAIHDLLAYIYHETNGSAGSPYCSPFHSRYPLDKYCYLKSHSVERGSELSARQTAQTHTAPRQSDRPLCLRRTRGPGRVASARKSGSEAHLPRQW